MLERFRSRGEPEPFRAFGDLRREMNRLFSDFATGSEAWGSYPPVTMIETKDDVVVLAELPGLERGDFNLTLNDGELTISGERKEQSLPEGARYIVDERMLGKFSRFLPVPTNVDRDRIKAEYKNGLLRVTLPKQEEAKAKEITIS